MSYREFIFATRYVSICVCLTTTIKFDKYNKIKKYHVLHHTVVHSVFVFYTLSLLQEIGTSHRAGEKAELDLTWKCRIAPRTCSNLARAEDIPWWEFSRQREDLEHLLSIHSYHRMKFNLPR